MSPGRKRTGPARKASGTRKSAKLPLRRTCGAVTVHQRLLEMDPGFRMRQVEIERMATRRMALGARVLFRAKPHVVPVVVHVVYKTAAENISAAQIRNQMRVLNRDFRAKNSDRSKVPAVWKGLVADARIEFVLAPKDPSGNQTSGITRTKTASDFFTDDDAVKSADRGGTDAWPTAKYLNIWVCDLRPWLGYAQLPGGPARTDGVVILHKAFGKGGSATAPFNLGRTTTHEVGHWLNLRHIWGDTEDCRGGDYIADTPNAEGPNYGKPAFPSVSCNNGPNGDMFMNYMDYVDDASMYMFTPQQVARMDATLAGPRSALFKP